MPQVAKFDPARGHRGRGPLKLPAEGRTGDTPAWPLPGRMYAAEREAWAQLWCTPQSVAWERLGWTRPVARYCRAMVEGEKPGASPALLAQVTAMEDRLGLTPKAMRLLLWEVVSDEVGDKRNDTAAAGVRDRIKAV